MRKTEEIYGLPLNVFRFKVVECIKTMKGALSTDIMRFMNIEINNNSWSKIERQLDLMTNLYKDECTNLWYVCPWAK